MEPDGWVRLHPLSAPLLAGRFLVLGLALSFRVWVDSVADIGSGGLTPEAGLVLWVGLGLVAGGLAVLGYGALAWRFRMYRVGTEKVELKTGIVFRSYRHLPFERIESVDTAQPLIPRLLGLAEVRVEAISKQGNELRLRYLGFSEAERLRLELAARRRSPTAEPSHVLEQLAPIVRVPAGELLMGYLALPALTGAAAAAVAAVVVGLVGGWEAVLAIVLVAVLAPIVLAVPVLVRLERLWDFRLDDAREALVINRGLLNLNTQRIVTGRIQALRIEQPLLWRAWGRYRVIVDIAGYRGVGNDAGAAAAILLPLAPDAIVRHVVGRLEVGADLTGLPYAPVPSRARWRSLRSRGFLVARTDTHVVVRSGVLWRRTSVVPHQRVQSARVTQGPWQRRLRLATLHVDSSGSRVRVAAAHRDAREAVALADDIARRARFAG